MTTTTSTGPASSGSTIDHLARLLARDFKVDVAGLAPDTPIDSLGIDSLGVAELLFAVEDDLGIRLPPEPVQLATLGEVVAYIDTLREAQAAPEAENTTAQAAAGLHP